MMNKKAQVSLEFMITLSVLLMLFLLFGHLFYQKFTLTNDMKQEITAKHLVRKLAENINEIVVVGHGHHMFLPLSGDFPGEVGYSLFLKPNQPSIILEAEDSNWKAPIFTKRVGCVKDECVTGSDNQTNLTLDGRMELKIANVMGSICIQGNESYDLKQGGTEEKIIPFKGDRNTTYPGVLEDSSDSRMFLYLNEDTGTVSLIFKHGDPSGSETVNLDFEYDNHRNSKMLFSDSSSGTVSTNGGIWSYSSGPEGGGLEFDPACVYIRVEPNTVTPDWYWVNADGERIPLNSNQDVEIIYP